MKITVIGSGYIGRNWAMLFASGGHHVVLFDISSPQLEIAIVDIKKQFENYKQNGLLKGSLSIEELCQLISVSSSLVESVSGATHVQECINEDLQLKIKLFKELDGFVGEDCTIASSTSTLPPSQFTADLCHKAQCLVAHPINPPYLMPLVELVMAPWTSEKTLTAVRELMIDIGQCPITLKKEVKGFIQPRIQYAAIQECLRLVRDGVMSVEDVDKVMSEGLGLRYAFFGPWEVIHMNANGVRDYMARYWKNLLTDVLADEGPPMDLKPEDATMVEIHKQLCEKIPISSLDDERKRRMELIGAFYKMKSTIN